MSIVLFDFAKSFVNGRLSADVFSEAYIELWKIEGNRGILSRDDSKLSECLSSIFCAADMYNSDDEYREGYEFDEKGLIREVGRYILQKESDFSGSL